MRHWLPWSTELAKNLDHLPSEFRAFVQNPASDEALLAALCAAYAQGGGGLAPQSSDPLGGGGAPPAPAAAVGMDPLGGLAPTGPTLFGKKKPAAEAIFGKRKAEAPSGPTKSLKLARETLPATPKSGALASKQARVKQLQQGVAAAVTFLDQVGAEPTEETMAEARLHEANLLAAHHPKFDSVKVDQQHLGGGLLATLVLHDKFPAALRTDALEELLTELKGESLSAEALGSCAGNALGTRAEPIRSCIYAF
ncbi:hypothetical protein [Pyruvatibacter mobilis]|uniref:hypothetical protein n=1 Tax=Pyruvatibacter mobilis TaxID=1712261 RepID=UPI003BAD42B2